MKQQRPFPLIPVGLVGASLIALLQLLRNDHVYTWAFVLVAISIAATAYAAAQELRAHQALAIARRRVGMLPLDEVHREIDRARRQERPLSIARVALRASGRRSTEALMHALLGHGSRAVMRSSDRAWREGRNIYLLLPETSRDHAKQMVLRVLEREEAVDLQRSMVVAFPTDAITVGAMFELLGSSGPAADTLIAEPAAQRGRGAVRQLADVRETTVPDVRDK